jgi:hypothetical protein
MQGNLAEKLALEGMRRKRKDNFSLKMLLFFTPEFSCVMLLLLILRHN